MRKVEAEVGQHVIHVVAVEPAGEYRLRLRFNDDTVQTVDFFPFLSHSRHPDIRAFLDRKRFADFRLEYGDLVWGDYELCFPVMDLYQNEIGHHVGCGESSNRIDGGL